MPAGVRKSILNSCTQRIGTGESQLSTQTPPILQVSLTVSPDPQTLQLARLVTDASRLPRSMSLRPFISQRELEAPSVTRWLTTMSMEEECGIESASFFPVAVGTNTGEEVSSLVTLPNSPEQDRFLRWRRREHCLRHSTREDMTLKNWEVSTDWHSCAKTCYLVESVA